MLLNALPLVEWTLLPCGYAPLPRVIMLAASETLTAAQACCECDQPGRDVRSFFVPRKNVKLNAVQDEGAP